MKKILPIFIVALLAPINLLANDITPEQALQIASQFASSPSTKKLSKRKAPSATPVPTLAHSMKSRVAAGKDNVYVINYGNDQGFVVVAGEMSADDVLLGYCDHGSFSYNDAPIQLKDLLAQYSDEADSLRLHQTAAAMAPRRARDIGTIVVGPLLTTTWNQWSPYNDLCPATDGGDALYQGHCPSGCYPTALAQVMNYWKWPKESAGRIRNMTTGKFDGEDFSGHVYDWDNMRDAYGWSNVSGTTPFTDVEGAAVAKLMADIGKAFGTMYGAGGSPTYFYNDPLIYNFSYNPDMQVHSASSAADLQSKMKADLDLLRPILYCGGPSGDTHALVCDGYTSTNYFHFNYGWGGSSDGWYKGALCDRYAKNPTIFTGVYPLESKNKVIDDIEYTLCKNGEAHIVQYALSNVKDVVLVIPDEVTDDEGNVYKVTTIRKHAFYGRGNFDKITIGGNIKSINPFSFISSTIDTLVIGDKMEEVPDGAFQMTKVQHLTIGASVKRIGKQAFRFCRVGTVISRSPGFEVDDQAFFEGGSGGIDPAWYGCITKLGSRVWAGLGPTFPVMPEFTQLREINKEAFYSIRFPANSEFHVLPNLKTIHPGAFVGSNLRYFKVDDDNPYYSRADYPWGTERSILYNKTKTSIIAALPTYTPMGSMAYSKQYPESVVKMEPGSVNPVYTDGSSAQTFIIPKTVVEMEGAFTECYNLYNLICLAPVPPVVSDTTFNEKLWNFRVSDRTARLQVPVGSEELYRKAPGWRQFSTIEGVTNENANTPYDLTPAQNQQFDMVVYYNTDEGRKSVNIPVADVANMQLDESGKKFVLTRSGMQDLVIDVVQVDSIAWKHSFVYDNAEVFDLNDSTLTAEGQYCTVTLGPTVIDEDVKLSIRHSVLTPEMSQGMKRGLAVDISLSNGEHELSGVAVITIPFKVGENERVQAVYFNRETGEWEAACFKYDEEQEAVVIKTDHFTEYGCFTFEDEMGPMAQVKGCYVSGWDLTKTLTTLYNIANNDNIDEAAIQAWRDDYSFWQSVGLDGGWNLLQAIGFQPDAVSEACDLVGFMGTMFTIYDVAAADIKGDDISVAANTLKAICGFVSGKLSSAVGTSIMSASMIGVATIGILLEQFGNKVQANLKRNITGAYRHYYSMEGVNTVWNKTKYRDGDLSDDYWGTEAKYPHHQYRTKKDWVMYFKPAFEQGRIKPENMQLLIEQAVRRYCDRFWEDNYDARELCYIWAKSRGMTSVLDAESNPSLQQQISEEYFSELMHGDIVSVFTELKNLTEQEAWRRERKAEEDLQAMMNTVLCVNIFDSSKEQGEKSKYAGWKVRFTDVPADVENPQEWECAIADDGTAKLECTKYALIRNKMKWSITLIDDRGFEMKKYSNSIPRTTGSKIVGTLDISKGGTEIEAPKLKDLGLIYDPLTVETFYTWAGTWNGGLVYHENRPEVYVLLDNALNKKARFQTEIEKFFKRHDYIVVDPYGNIKIGDDIVGKMEDGQGKGSFTINTTHPFTERTIPEFVEAFNRGDFGSIELFLNLLSGTIQHKINCQFTVVRDPEGDGYIASYTGEGTYKFDAEIVDRVEGVDFDNLGNPQHVIADQISTRQVSQEGKVTLNFTVKLR